jgi:hypothetical protein
VFGLGHAYSTLSPDGYYETLGIETAGSHFYSLRNGRASIIFEYRKPTEMGTYQKSGEAWIWVQEKGIPIEIHPSLLWLRYEARNTNGIVEKGFLWRKWNFVKCRKIELASIHQP